MIRERYQRPVLGDTVKLKILVYSSNQKANAHQVLGVTIFYLDIDQRSEGNPDGRIEVAAVLPANISNDAPGEYSVDLELNQVDFRIGDYVDRWEFLFEDADNYPGIIENDFTVYRDLWYTSPKPLIYELGFNLSPNKIVQGTRKYLRVDLDVYAPDASTREAYYYSLATMADVHISIVQDEGEGYDPQVPGNNTIVNWSPVQFREDNSGYYLLDTSVDPRPQMNGAAMPNGIYLVQFRAGLGETLHLSPRFHLQIYS